MSQLVRVPAHIIVSDSYWAPSERLRPLFHFADTFVQC
jgi:hypothetical protein